MTTDTTVVASADALSSIVGSETVILQFDAGIYFGLNEVGSRVWELVQAPRSIGEIRDALLDEYDVTAEACEVAVVDLVERLRDHRLVDVAPAPE